MQIEAVLVTVATKFATKFGFPPLRLVHRRPAAALLVLLPRAAWWTKNGVQVQFWAPPATVETPHFHLSLFFDVYYPCEMK